MVVQQQHVLHKRQQLAADGGIAALRLGYRLLDSAPVVRMYGVAGDVGAIHRETGNDLLQRPSQAVKCQIPRAAVLLG